MYQTFFDLINQYCYNGEAVLGSIHYDVATLISTLGVVIVVAVPFFITFTAIKFICGGWR